LGHLVSTAWLPCDTVLGNPPSALLRIPAM
jgi:hypothetical protein